MAKFLSRFFTSGVLAAAINKHIHRAVCGAMAQVHSSRGEYYRADGVRITHDPYSQGMAEKYGAPGKTDDEGFDPYHDTVGPGIYGGRVQRNDVGKIVIGKQYQNHNSRPGPVYAGGGYAPITEALRDPSKLRQLLNKYPDLVNDVTTGGAQPLHMCGMSKANSESVSILTRYGADLEAVDTYGMTPLHRMASNNLAEAAKALLNARADVANPGLIQAPPLEIARGSNALDVIRVLQDYSTQTRYGHGKKSVSAKAPPSNIQFLLVDKVANVKNAESLNGKYLVRKASEIPEAFAHVCQEQNWNVQEMWTMLNGARNDWYKHDNNDSYMYYNLKDKRWWLDGPDGLGVFVMESPKNGFSPPAYGWTVLGQNTEVGGGPAHEPLVRIFREGYIDAGLKLEL